MSSSQGALGLLDLPSETLLAILMQLDVEDRVRCASACKGLGQLAAAAGPELFGAVVVELHSATQLADFGSWLLARKRTLESLAVTIAPGPELARCGERLRPQLLGRLIGSPLRTLSLSCAGPTALQLDGWLATLLSGLESLHVRVGRVTIHHSLSQLRKLTRLSLANANQGEHMLIPPNSLPSQLRELEIVRFHAARNAVMAGPLPRLERLRLSHSNREVHTTELEGLGALTSLTSLALTECHLAAPPPGVSALASLRELDLSGNGMVETFSFKLGHLLSGLASLTKLDLSYTFIQWLPGDLLTLTQLQELSLEGNPFEGPLPDPAPGHALRTLSLSLRAAAPSGGQLAALTSLETLRLGPGAGYSIVPPDQLLSLLGAIAGLPRLRRLEDQGGQLQLELLRSREAAQAFQQLLAARPELRPSA